MKPCLVLLLGAIVFSYSIVSSFATLNVAPSVGVKKGDWIEYNVSIAGTPPQIHNITWMKIEVLQVEGPAFPVNLTVRYVNGTLFSSIWKFNFTQGNEEGWLIIPSNLGPGDSFYDAYSKTIENVTIERQAQQTVLGASRTVTYSNDTSRHKEWDKTTGVFVSSWETFRNWNVSVNMTATNLWSLQILGLDQTVFFVIVGAVTLATVPLVVAIGFVRKKRIKHLVLREDTSFLEVRS